MALKLTPSGTDLLLRAIAGEVNIKFTAIQLGNGADAGKSAAALSNPLLTAEISSYEVGDVFVTLRTTFSNSQVSASFRATEVGVLAHDPDTADGTLLYAYQYTPEGESDYIPASTDKVLETQMDVLVYIGDAENVTASISQSLVYASRADLEAHVKNMGNPHKVTKEQVGLGNVPNAATNDLTPTYTEASALVGMKSGEKLSIAFGKIAKSVSSLIAHIGTAGKNVHKETPTSIGAAPKSHKHSTTDITSGVLGLARGGTDVTSYSALRDKLGVNCKISVVKPTNIYLQKTTSSSHWNGKEHQNYAAFGNNTFVIIGVNEYGSTTTAAYVSDNGITYDMVEEGIPNEAFYGIAYGNGLFVAVFETKVIYSEDGRTWTEVDLGTTLNAARICFGIDTFMILAIADGVSICYTSKDAQTWVSHEMPAVDSKDRYTGLCFGDGKFVAITTSEYVKETTITISEDKGDSWSSLKPISGFHSAKDIFFAHGKYIVWHRSGSGIGYPELAVTEDLSSWSVIDDLSEGFCPEIMGVTNTGFCASGRKTGGGYYYCFSSDDGFSWHRTAKTTTGVDCFLSAKGKTWAIMNVYNLMVSDNGDSWTSEFYQISDQLGNTFGPLKGA